jgi:hypothetical protein
MRPRIFLSSTIKDLAPIRDALRDVIQEMGYEPVMSDYGEVGYLPTTTAEESCYISLDNCDILVAVIGKRYGSIGRDDRSITHNEVRRARDLGVPVYCFIERDTRVQLQVLAGNPTAQLPDFDAPDRLLAFVNEVATADRSNSVIDFSSVDDAKNRLKLQLAHLFHHLLSQKNDLIRKSLADLLAEVKTIRYRLPPENTEESAGLLCAAKFFCEDLEEKGAKWQYKRLVLRSTPNFAHAIRLLLMAPTFADFCKAAHIAIRVMTLEERRTIQAPAPHTGQVLAASNGPLLGRGSSPDLHYVLYPNLELWIDQRVLNALEDVHFKFKSAYTQEVRDTYQAVTDSTRSMNSK